MKMLLVLLSCFALVGAALADPPDNHKKGKGKHGDEAEVAPQGGNQGKIKGNGPQNRKNMSGMNQTTGTGSNQQFQSNKFSKKGHKFDSADSNVAVQHGEKLHGRNKSADLPNANPFGGNKFQGKKFEKKHFELASKAKGNIPNVKFKEGKHIEGAEHWKGNKYVVFKNYKCEWHDHDWWHNHHNKIVIVFGGAYYWDNGYWFPAFGYQPNAFYAYEGPIYAGSVQMDPGQVVANVQAALQERGYFVGEIDGALGPITRAALAKYQEDQGFEPTGAIDEPTLVSFGMA
ncbi:MAG: peptidoglycan-binding domain-containing protein [Verrucomicrobiota bacterium]